ncbi:hypothetical protein [Streptomyces sp. NBC_00344]|uniref:hypothetical protein n=1 Tax=Streptomyces sp. NBC_00344 TaxID=2975720 RepID=UPI002E1B8CAE
MLFAPRAGRPRSVRPPSGRSVLAAGAAGALAVVVALVTAAAPGAGADGRRQAPAPKPPEISLDDTLHQLTFTPGGGTAVASYTYRIGNGSPAYRAGAAADGSLTVSVPATLDDIGRQPVTVRADDASGHSSTTVTGTFSFINRNPGSADYQVRRVEAEALLPTGTAQTTAVRQTNCCGGNRFSGGSQAWFRATRTGDTYTLPFDVTTAADYAVVLKQTRGPDYGTVSYAIDSRRTGTVQDGYAPTVSTRPVSLGELGLTRGIHWLTLTVEGRNPAASGRYAGLDYLELTPLLQHEAEHLLPAGRSATLPLAREPGALWSGGAQVAFTGRRPGDHFALGFDAPADGWYALGTEQSTGPQYGRVSFAVDGEAAGTPFDAYRKTAATRAADLGIRYLTGGRHTMTFAAAGRRAPSPRYRIGVDLIKVFPLTGSYEAELVTSASTGRSSVQRNCCGPMWSGGHQRLVRALRPGDHAEFTFAVPLDGPYSLNAVMTRRPEYGGVVFAIDGRPAGRFDGRTHETTTRPVHLGTRDFTEGLHTLTVTRTDGAGPAAGHAFGVDRIDVYPEDEKASERAAHPRF